MELTQPKKIFEIGKTLKLKLYPYQEMVVKYCLIKGNAIIVAPCGSGKTPMMLGVYVDLRRRGTISPAAKGLIVVKSSLKIQWKKEIEKFSDMKASVIDTFNSSTGSLRKKLKTRQDSLAKIMKGQSATPAQIKNLNNEIKLIQYEIKEKFEKQFSDEFDLYIANYETLRDEFVRKQLLRCNLEFMCCDEIHYIKSDTAARSKAVYAFNKIKTKFGTTATPIQKGPMDAFSISKFVSPNTFPSKSAYTERYVRFSQFNGVYVPTGSKNEQELNRLLSDYMLVVKQEDVAKQLPSLNVIPKYCQLTKAQEKMNAMLMSEIADLKEQEADILKQAAIKGSTPQSEAELQKVQCGIMARQTFASELADSEELLSDSESYISKQYCTGSPSGKIEVLMDLLEEIFSSGEKAAVFSKYAKLQPIITREAKKHFKGLEIAFVNGAMSAAARYNEVYEKFAKKPSCKLLLLSDAGAEGLNLSGCKYLIEMEPADSYMIQTQRHGRIERADSVHKNVFVYQLIAVNSFDEIGQRIIEKKERFDKKIIKGVVDAEQEDLGF